MRRCRVRLCVPHGGRAPSGASVHAVRCRRRLQRRPDGDGSKRRRGRIARRCGRRHPSRTGGGDDGAIVSTRRAPPFRVYGCAWQSCVCSVESTRQAKGYVCVCKSAQIEGIIGRKRVPSPRPLGPYNIPDLKTSKTRRSRDPGAATGRRAPTCCRVGGDLKAKPHPGSPGPHWPRDDWRSARPIGAPAELTNACGRPRRCSAASIITGAVR
jgi:hypothetical protein